MEQPSLRERAMQSADVLLDILEQTRKGRVEVKVERISRVGKGMIDTYKLKLNQRLFDEESVFFRDLTTNEEHDSEVIQVKEYDPDKRVLVVVVKKKSFTLANKRPEDVVVISDLRFLIERWRKFMEEHGGRLGLPDRLPSIPAPTLPDDTTEEQRTAIYHLLRYPFSYVWGAPGTGKTRYVLSQVIVAYLRAGKRVGIFAPTNLSLEQVLSGVLEVTDKEGITRDGILRMGNPTHSFAQKYPEVCELQGTERLLRATRKQIGNLEKVLGVAHHTADEEVVGRLTQALPQLLEGQKQHEQLESRLDTAGAEKDKANQALENTKEAIQEIKEKITSGEERMRSLSHRVKKFLGGKQAAADRQQFAQHQKELEQLLKKKDAQKVAFDQARRQVEQAERYRQDHNSSWQKTVQYWRGQSLHNSELKERLAQATPQSLIQSLQKVVGLWQEQSADREISTSLKEEYQDIAPEELESRLQELRAREHRLLRSDTEERVKQVQVVAATLDTLVGRFPEADLMVDHFFVDEASYANMAKVLPLFVYNKPVTFLGDHLQLPPVTELEKRHLEMKGNLPAVLWAESALQVAHFFRQSIEQIAQKFFYAKTTPPPDIPQIDLTRTHRFGPSLAALLNQFVYRNQFGSALPEGTDTGVLWLQVDKTTRRKQRSNPAEAHAIQHLLPRMLRKGLDDFAIVAPYTKQIDTLRRTMPEVYEAERILTVHKSQGREWDYVIFSICDTDDAYFVDSTKRHSHGLNLLNTAVSRTRKGLILVGDIRYWRDQPGQLLAELVKIGKEIR